MTDTETSSRRAEANRRNAQKSTGPRTPEGKGRSRFNAIKHGIRAATPVLPGEDVDALNARLDRWTADLSPRDDVERFLVHRAVRLSWQLDRADRALDARSADARADDPDRLARQADEVHGAGPPAVPGPPRPHLPVSPVRDDEASDCLSRSGRGDDPDDPARLLVRLEATAIGCAWLLDRWDELRGVLEAGGAWQPPDRFRRSGCWAGSRWTPGTTRECVGSTRPAPRWARRGKSSRDVATELLPRERRRFLERVEERLAPTRSGGAEAGRSALRAMIAEEEGRLEEVLALHLERASTSGPGGRRQRGGGAAASLPGDLRPALLRVLEALRKRQRESDGPGRRSDRRAAKDARRPSRRNGSPDR